MSGWRQMESQYSRLQMLRYIVGFENSYLDFIRVLKTIEIKKNQIHNTLQFRMRQNGMDEIFSPDKRTFRLSVNNL